MSHPWPCFFPDKHRGFVLFHSDSRCVVYMGRERQGRKDFRGNKYWRMRVGWGVGEGGEKKKTTEGKEGVREVGRFTTYINSTEQKIEMEIWTLNECRFHCPLGWNFMIYDVFQGQRGLLTFSHIATATGRVDSTERFFFSADTSFLCFKESSEKWSSPGCSCCGAE